MASRYKNLISSSSTYRASINALDNDIKRMEQNMLLNPFMPTEQNLELKKLEMDEKKMAMEREKMEHEKQSEEERLRLEEQKLTQVFSDGE